jgi:hypothetical protein
LIKLVSYVVEFVAKDGDNLKGKNSHGILDLD